LTGRKTDKRKALTKQRVKRKKGFRVWKMRARGVGSAIVKISVALSTVTLMSLIFVYCYHYVLTSPFFALERLNITGLDRKRHDSNIWTCGIKKGQNLLALKLNELRKKIESDPWIRSARLERRLPNTLCVSVVREEAWAIVVAEKLYYMNRWGEIFKEVEALEPVDLPIITGLSDLGSEAGEELKEIAALLNMLKNDKGPIGLSNLSEIHINDTRHFSVYFRGIPAEIQMGPAGLKVQLAKLRKLLRHLKNSGRIQEASRIDLEYAGGAVVSFQPARRSEWQAGRGSRRA